LVDLPPSNDERQEYSGFLVVYLDDTYFDIEVLFNFLVSEERSLQEVAEAFGLDDLLAFLDTHDLPPSFQSIDISYLGLVYELEQSASESQLPTLRHLMNYWQIDLQDRPDDIEEIAQELSQIDGIDLAYPELMVYSAAVNYSDEPFFGSQGYLQPAPQGIDALWAWGEGITGSDIGLVDLELGWNLRHTEFSTKSPSLHSGEMVSTEVAHGTAVLAIVIGDDNTTDGLGIAPMVDIASSTGSVRVVSHKRVRSRGGAAVPNNVAEAVIAVIPDMSAGDILLVEVERGRGLPTETDPRDLEAFRHAFNSGIVVVEAGGNAGRDLDNYTRFGEDQHVLNRDLPDEFEESGTILVGAGNSEMPHDRRANSNYGTRIDCYAWGDSVATTGFPPSNSFTDTSAATAIIAGASILLQQAYIKKYGPPHRLSPKQMRLLLSSNTGTPQGGGRSGNIGNMPNLRAILEGGIDSLLVDVDI